MKLSVHKTDNKRGVSAHSREASAKRLSARENGTIFIEKLDCLIDLIRGNKNEWK